MFKKIAAICMAVLCVNTASVYAVENTETATVPQNLMIGNTGFENELRNGTIEDWYAGLLGGWKAELNLAFTRSGKKSLSFSIDKEKAEEKPATLLSRAKQGTFEVDKNYVFSAWVRTEEPLQCTNRQQKNFGAQVYARVEGDPVKANLSTPVHDTKGDWMKLEVKFKLLSETDTVAFYLRLTENTYGKIWFDDVEVFAEADIDPEAPKVEKDKGEIDWRKPVPCENLLPIPEGSPDLFINGGFEEVNADGSPVGDWGSYGGKWNEHVSIVNDAYEGKNAVLIKSDNNNNVNPWIRQKGDSWQVLPDAEYQITLWLKTIFFEKTGPQLKIEFYDAEGKYFGLAQSDAFGQTNGVWHQKSCVFKTPPGTARVEVFLRLYEKGEILYDDVHCHMTKAPSKILFDGDTFLYTEWKDTTIGASINKGAYKPKETEVFDMKLKDGDAVLDSRLGVPASPEAVFNFETALLTEKGKEYQVEATLYESPGGAILETANWTVIRYDRPTMINDNGDCVINGEVITPVWGYHVFMGDERMEAAKKTGVNIVQGTGFTVQNALAYLDLAQKHGMYASLMLYGGGDMKPPSYPHKIEESKKVVEACKDHPALFGYIVMDEPGIHLSDPIPHLIASYKLIRDIDPVHPIIIQDAVGTGFMDTSTACSDILIMHEYPMNKVTMELYGMELPIITMERHEEELKGTDGSHIRRKPVHVLGQSFGEDREVAEAFYLPTKDEAKNVIYQFLMEGVKGIGYYSFEESNGLLKDWELFPGLVEFAEEEMFFLTDALIFENSIFFNEGRIDDVRWRTFVKDGKLYVMAMNLKEEQKTITIPLESQSGAIKVGSYTGVLKGGTELPKEISGDGSVTVSFIPFGTVLYEVTPEVAIDISILENSFEDMGNHIWAEEAVEFLNEEGVVNSTGVRTFSPGTNITRADFAMFLIRALNIGAESTAVFADVDPNAYYAKEIAAGRAAGILKGVGDDAYNPDAEITRQDMMVIVKRGLAYVDKNPENSDASVLEAFSDRMLIADYAQDALAAMVKSGIIKGNADGTLNPKGSATRAEAAMIMYRIMQ